MIERLDSLIVQVGPEAYAVLLLAAMIEYVIPPFPGDTVVLLGGVLAARGEKSWLLVLLAVTLGSVIGSAIDYGFGVFVARRLHRRAEARPIFGLSLDRLSRVEERMRRSGAPLIAFNRFLPAIRGLLFVAAGAARMPFGKVMALGALSALLWNVLILGLGHAVGGNAERLEKIVREYQRAVLGILAVVALAILVRFVLRRRAEAGR